MYGDVLSKLAAGGGAAAPASMGVDLGAPPKMPGLPPPPTNVGTMPTGGPSTDKKAMADEAILKLRDLKGGYPQLGQMIDASIDAIKAAATSAGAPPTGPAASASPPGTPPPAVPPPSTSGAPGPL